MILIASWAQRTPGKIDGYHFATLLERQVFHRQGGRTDAGVVKQHIQSAKSFPNFFKEGSNAYRIADVGRHSQHLSADGIREPSRFLKHLRTAPGQRYRVTRSLQAKTHGPADAAACAGDQRDLAFHCHKRNDPLFRYANLKYHSKSVPAHGQRKRMTNQRAEAHPFERAA
jgi:hypothetical protein